MEVGSGEVLLTGEAESTGGVIRALERSERFESVRRRSPSVPSEGGELFDLRAARTDARPAREGGAS
jgi:hypothetical protein